MTLNRPGLFTLNTGRRRFTARGSEQGEKVITEGCCRSQGRRLGHASESFSFLIISRRLKGSLVPGKCPMMCWPWVEQNGMTTAVLYRPSKKEKR